MVVYNRQPIHTPVIPGNTAPIPELIFKASASTKNHRRKIRLMHECGWVCNYCKNCFEMEQLTLDHILPRYIAPKSQYNNPNNWQLLCKACHKIKLTLEHSFIGKITQMRLTRFNNIIIDVTELVVKCMEFIHKTLSKRNQCWCIRNAS